MPIPNLIFGYFEDSSTKQGAAGLTVTVDLDSYNRSTGARTAIATGASASEGRNGIYLYQIADFDPDLMYIAVFKTAATTTTTKAAAGWIAQTDPARVDAKISERLATAGYTAPLDASATQAAAAAALADYDAATADDVPSAEEIADQVWDEPQADHTTAGTTGAGMAAAGGAADPLANAVPGNYAPGTGGHRLGMIGAGMIRAVSPVGEAGDRLTIDAGDSYTGGRALEWIDPGTWPNLTDYTAELVIEQRIAKPATISGAGGSNQRITVELESADTRIDAGSAIPFAVKVHKAAAGDDPAETATLARGQTLIRAEVIA